MLSNGQAGTLVDKQPFRYEAVLRISESLKTCCQAEQLASILADQLSAFVDFDHLDVAVFEEDSTEVEWLAWGKGRQPFLEIPTEELRSWQVQDSQEPLYIADWKTDGRFSRLKASISNLPVDMTSILRIPLTTPHRRIGTLGIASAFPNAYTTEDIEFLRLVARVVAFAIDGGLSLNQARTAQAELQRQNDRLQLLLNLTNRITSNLELREVLRTVSGNIRELMQCDAVAVVLLEASGKSRLYALDFPQGKGLIREEEIVTTTGAAKRVMGTLRPEIVNHYERDDVAPEMYDKVVGEGLKSTCLIPLVNRGRALGMLVIARTTEISFTPQDLEFLTQAAGEIAIAIENALAYREISELKDKLAQEKLYLEDEIRSEMNFEEIIGKSAVLRRVLRDVETVGRTESTVLIYGETGTGKELVARALHNLSPRRSGGFVKLNCAAIPTGLLESELFGHEKGAFTGAIAQRVGRFELANGGTIFLDEVGEIPLELQPKLLRVLQEREFERLGSTRTLRSDARLIAATNRDLAAMVDEQKFRSDLFYRLNVFPIRIPPLRERPEDISLLVRHFTQQFARRMNKRVESIPTETMNALVRYHWPGNIRELQNVIERAVIVSSGPVLQVPLSELKASSAANRRDSRPKSIETLQNMQGLLEETERKQILAALEETEWVVAGPKGAAARLGMKRSTLQMRIQRLGITRSNKSA